MSGPVVLKLGGSVITRKEDSETVDTAALERAATTIARTPQERLVLIHGGGSFGHVHAERHGITETRGSHDVEGIYAVHDAMRRLNDAVVTRLHEEGVPAVPVHPLSAGARTADGELHLPVEQVRTLLAEGFIPVTHGDVVAHEGQGATVLSGDEVVSVLATALDARRVGVCSGVPGVMDADGAVIDRIERFGEVADAVGASDAPDVTGGMAGKVNALLELPMDANVFDLDGLQRFLAGEAPGTTVVGE